MQNGQRRGTQGAPIHKAVLLSWVLWTTPKLVQDAWLPSVMQQQTTPPFSPKVLKVNKIISIEVRFICQSDQPLSIEQGKRGRQQQQFHFRQTSVLNLPVPGKELQLEIRRHNCSSALRLRLFIAYIKQQSCFPLKCPLKLARAWRKESSPIRSHIHKEHTQSFVLTKKPSFPLIEQSSQRSAFPQ